MQEEDLTNIKENENDELEISKEPERGHWESRWEFLFSCIGLSVGIGNVWRFPYLAFENGGGAFLLPYLVILFLIGKPIYLLEVAIGQYSQVGPSKIWKLAPISKGIGIATFLANILVTLYFNVIISYTLFYLFASWSKVLPWSGCYESWGADNKTCFVRSQNKKQLPLCSNLGVDVKNYTVGVNCTNTKLQTASEQYWERNVLNIRQGGLTHFGDVGSLKWELCLCNFLAWIIIFLCMIKGIKSIGKVVHFTGTFPFFVLILIVFNGLLNHGSMDGIKFFFIPKWNKLLTFKVWHAAAEQMFYSLSISWGSLIVFGSYNKFNHRVHIDAYIVCILDLITSLLAGCAIFSVLGNWSAKLNLPIDQVVKSGRGLAFVVYPEALTGLPNPHFSASLFFFMLFTLGLDSQFASLETILTCIYDVYPFLRKHKSRLTFAWCMGTFLLGLPCFSESGAYIVDMMDNWTSQSVLCIGTCEIITFMWIYGVRRIVKDFEFMLGFRFHFYWIFCWAVTAPLGLITIFITKFIYWKALKYGDVAYPNWATSVGWAIYLIVTLPIPITGLYVFFKHIKDPKITLRPSPSWGPGGEQTLPIKVKGRKGNYRNFTEQDSDSEEEITTASSGKKGIHSPQSPYGTA